MDVYSEWEAGSSSFPEWSTWRMKLYRSLFSFVFTVVNAINCQSRRFYLEKLLKRLCQLCEAFLFTGLIYCFFFLAWHAATQNRLAAEGLATPGKHSKWRAAVLVESHVLCRMAAITFACLFISDTGINMHLVPLSTAEEADLSHTGAK